MAMIAPAIELQKAINAALARDDDLIARLGGVHVQDQMPANVPFPHATFGYTSVYDWSTGTESGNEHLLTLHVWSKARGQNEVRELMQAVAAQLGDAGLVLEGDYRVNLRLEFSEIVFDEDLSVHHGLLRFRAVTEPA